MSPPNNELTGTIAEVFAHRFVLETADGKLLADIGPKALERVKLKKGDKVRIEGEQKPSEIKVARIAIGGGELIPTHHGENHHHDKPFDIDDAKAIARTEGYQITSDLHPKKKHFETSATKDGRSLDIHIHRDGVHEH